MDKKTTLLIASDHNGNDLRDYLINRLQNECCIVDLGPRTDTGLGTIKVDYTAYAEQMAYAIRSNSDLRGILVCGTGIGMSIAANRFRGVKASLVGSIDDAKKTREHNDSNVLCLGSWRTSKPLAEEIASAWLDEDFGSGRHETRVANLDNHSDEDVVLVPGVFEILHAGHIKLFEFAKNFGRVVVALNTDRSAEVVKSRSIRIKQEERINTLRHIDVIDEVILMDDDNAGELLRSTGAKYIVKGMTESEAAVRSSDRVPDDVEVKLFPHDHCFSSLKIRESFQ